MYHAAYTEILRPTKFKLITVIHYQVMTLLLPMCCVS